MDRNEGIWAYSNTGTKAHAFVQTDDNGNRRAMCRATIVRSESAIFHRKTDLVGTCTRCATLACAMYDRAEASMAPATEAHDLGHVAQVAETPADETDPAPELPVGARIVARNGEFGTVTEGQRGRVTTKNHPNYGLAYVSVLLDGVGTRLPRRSRLFVEELTNLDALHAEALETDAEETAKGTPAPVEPSTPQRWRYTADLKADGSVSRIGGYVTAPTRLRALYEVRNAHKTDGTYIHDLILTPLN